MVSMLNYHFACASRSVLADHKKTIYPCPTIHNVYIILYISIVCIIKTMLKPKRPENVILTTLRDEVCAEIVVVQVFCWICWSVCLNVQKMEWYILLRLSHQIWSIVFEFYFIVCTILPATQIFNIPTLRTHNLLSVLW